MPSTGYGLGEETKEHEKWGKRLEWVKSPSGFAQLANRARWKAATSDLDSRRN
jgi:hypothetical protein